MQQPFKPGEVAALYFREAIAEGATQSELGGRFGIDQTTVGRVLATKKIGTRTWDTLSADADFRAFAAPLVSEANQEPMAAAREERWVRLTRRTQEVLELGRALEVVDLLERAKELGVLAEVLHQLAYFVDAAARIASRLEADAARDRETSIDR